MDPMDERAREIGREKLDKALIDLANKLFSDPEIMAYLAKFEHPVSVHQGPLTLTVTFE